MTQRNRNSVKDVELIKVFLDGLPDLTRTSLTKEEALSQLKENYIRLASIKGLSAERIRGNLSHAGIEASLESIREICHIPHRP
jgi:hypothetical protein